jgi:hypothetical protein
MRKLATLSMVFGACLIPYIASAQTAGPETLVLVTWVQAGAAAGAVPTTQLIIGTFPDANSCVAAAQQTRLSNGATALLYNFLCIPNK